MSLFLLKLVLHLLKLIIKSFFVNKFYMELTNWVFLSNKQVLRYQRIILQFITVTNH